jgi:hypothetical protein
MQCATHPTVETELACSRCGKAICPRCMVHTPVGARCRECAQVRRIPTYNLGGGTFARAAAAAVFGGVALGIAWWLFNPLSYFFFGVIVGLAVGYGSGELVSIATNRKVGPPLQVIAAGGALIAYAVRLGLLFVVSDWVFDDLRVDLGGLIGVVLACFVAAGRLR